MENYKIQNFVIFLLCNLIELQFLMFFIVSDEVSTVAVYFLELKFIE